MATRSKKRKTSPKSSPKSAKRLARPAAWVSDLSPLDRAKKFDYLSRTVRDLRKFFTGFDARDGYDLRHPERLSAQRVKAITQYGGHLHSMTATPHVRVAKPRSKKKQAALESFTGQRYSGMKKSRAYVVPVDNEAAQLNTKVSVTDAGQVRVERHVGKAHLIDEFYLFSDYGFDSAEFISLDDVIKASRYMVKKVLPSGTYVLWSKVHGAIWLPLDRDEILLNLNGLVNKYLKANEHHAGFANTLLGWKYQGDYSTAEVTYTEREQRRRAAHRRKAALRKEMAARLQRWSKHKGYTR